MKKIVGSAFSHEVAVAAPAWVEAWFARAEGWVDGGVWARVAGRFALLTTVIAGAEGLSDEALQARVTGAYGEVLSAARGLGRYPLRFWNHVPRITAAASQHRDRYMVFNAGRYEAFVKFYATAAEFDRTIATASGVGTPGGDLVIHCLAGDVPGVSFNNPRQVAPYHYSKRFGPLPPCFARATRVPGPEGLLLVGGTAAIRGEDSVFREDLGRQIGETFVNMAALVATARGEEFVTKQAAGHLACYRELRVYLPNMEDQGRVAKRVGESFANVRRVEFVPAELCRPELLVEIEGVAELP